MVFALLLFLLFPFVYTLLGCTKPILRGLGTEEYLTHLREHVTLSDRLLSNMLRRVASDEVPLSLFPLLYSLSYYPNTLILFSYVYFLDRLTSDRLRSNSFVAFRQRTEKQ